MRLNLVVAIGVLSLGCSASNAQLVSDLAKAQSPTILSRAQAQQRQELIVEFDAGTLPASIAKRRVQLGKLIDGRRAAALTAAQAQEADAELAAQDDALLQELQQGLRQIKSEVLEHESAGARIIQDFSNLPAALVEVPTAQALNGLLKSKRVKLLNENGPVYPAADWAHGSYTDLSLIAAPSVNNGISPHTGAGTRVVVVDQPAYIAGLVGFNSGDGCYPYSGLNFSNDNLAGGFNSGAGCRVWNAFNFATRAEQYCANPYGNVAGVVCPHDHGTAVMNTVLRTAPSSYITALQVFDRNGNSNQSYIMDALNWVIDNRNTQPRIVAVNLSVRMSDTKYTDYCNGEAVAPTLKSILGYGIIPVIATGNYGWKDGVTSPACVQGMLTVGAVTDSTTPQTTYDVAGKVVCSDPSLSKDQVGCFSNSHPKMLSVLAPGINIGNSMLFDEKKHSGTSLAAPHVAGQVAILRGSDLFFTKSAAEIIDRIKYNGTPIADRLAPSIVTTRIDIAKSINPPKIGSIIVSPTTASLQKGSTLVVTVTGVKDTSGAAMPMPKLLVWSSSNPAAATVDWTGKVTAVGEGRATISATSDGVSGSVSVTVNIRNGGGPDCSKDPRLCS